MSEHITISGVQAGASQPLFPSWQLPYPEAWRQAPIQVTLRDLIARVVREEVTAFQQRQAEQRTLRVLSARQIDQGAARGKIDSGGQRDIVPSHIDAAEALQTALEAFDDGLYFVFIDDEQVEELDAPIRLRSDSSVTFLRLVALAGG